MTSYHPHRNGETPWMPRRATKHFAVILCLHLFSEKLTILRHIWFIGDELLDNTANSLRKLKNEYIFDASKPQLGIFKDFHVEAFHDSEVKPTYKNILRKVRNNLTAALNKFPQILPTYVVVLLNNNVIQDQAFVEYELKSILKKVLNDVGRLLSIRKDQLAAKSRNLLVDTEVFFTRPLPKPTIFGGDQRFKNSRRQVNAMLDRLALTYDFKILNVDVINCSQKVLFENSGQLSDFGKEQLWIFLAEFLESRQRNIVTALKRAHTTTADAATQIDHDELPYNSWLRDESATSENQHYDDRNCTYGHRDFDEYHTRYDRNNHFTAQRASSRYQ